MSAGRARPLPGRREHRKQATRRELLEAGRRLFGQRGLYESRIEDLTRGAGIAKGTIYGYFENKEALIEAVVTSGLSELLGHVHREAQGARDRDDLVERAAAAHLRFFEENPDLMRILHQARGMMKFGRPETPKLRRVLKHYLAGLGHILTLKRPAPAAKREDSMEVAALLFGALSGVASTRAAVAGFVPAGLGSRATLRGMVALVRGFERPAPRRASRPRAGGTRRRATTTKGARRHGA